MARSKKRKQPADLDTEKTSLLDVVDAVINRGVVLNGDLVLGVANVDLVYVKLSALLAAIDKVAGEPTRHQTPRARKHKDPK